jgi:type IV secretory pathway VirB2 component (pilin)
MSASPRENNARALTPRDERTSTRTLRLRWDALLVPLAALLAVASLAVGPAMAAPLPPAHQLPGGPVPEGPNALARLGPLAVSAATNCAGNATCDLDATLTNVQYFLIGIAVLLAGVAIAIYGIQYMLGSLEEMDPQKKSLRKKQAISIVVGLVTVLLSVVLVSVAKGLIVTS